MHVFYFIFVYFRLVTVFDFGLVHYASEPFILSGVPRCIH